MLKKLFSRNPLMPLGEPDLTKGYKTVELMADLMADLLISSSNLMPLSMKEVRLVARYMQEQFIAQNTVFIREGDKRDTGFMVLLLEGEVTVENLVINREDPMIISVLGPGSLIGELGLLDGHPRYASCTAATLVHCSILTRESLQQLMLDKPVIAAKLILAMASRMAERLRDNTDKLKMYVQLTQAMQQELSARTPR